MVEPLKQLVAPKVGRRNINYYFQSGEINCTIHGKQMSWVYYSSKEESALVCSSCLENDFGVVFLPAKIDPDSLDDDLDEGEDHIPSLTVVDGSCSICESKAVYKCYSCKKPVCDTHGDEDQFFCCDCNAMSPRYVN